MALICSTPHQHFPADVLGQEPHLFSMRFATNELRTPSARAATSSCGVAGLVRVYLSAVLKPTRTVLTHWGRRSSTTAGLSTSQLRGNKVQLLLMTLEDSDRAEPISRPGNRQVGKLQVLRS